MSNRNSLFFVDNKYYMLKHFFNDYLKYRDIFLRVKDIKNWVNSECVNSEKNIEFFYPWNEDHNKVFSRRFLVFFETKVNQENLKDYVCIYQSPWNEIYEKKTAPISIRKDLTKKEKKILLKYIRYTSKSFFLGNKSFDELKKFLKEESKIFSEVCDVDVAFWLHGELRGSRIIKGRPLYESIIEGTIATLKDVRFKPIKEIDLDKCVFECSVVPHTWLRLLRRDICIDKPYPNHVYRAISAENEGWYFPTVFNVMKIRNTKDYLESLIYKKAGIQEKTQELNIFSSPCISFSENLNKEFHCLNGPVSFQEDTNKSKDLIDFKEVLFEHISKNIDDQGYVVPVLGSVNQIRNKIDLIRHAFLFKSLAESSKLEAENNYEECLNKLYSFCICLENNKYEIPTYAKVYFAEAARLRERYTEASALIQKIHTKNLDHRSILGNIQILLAKRNILGEEYQDEILKTYLFWEKNKKIISFASVADLLILIKDLNFDFFMEIIKWYKKNQYKDGSFPNKEGSNYVYTRGTAKIAESLSLSEEGSEMAEKALFWLKGMQYTENELRFVLPANRTSVIGGIRHDYWNTEVWTDSASHTHLALTRFLSK